MSWYFPHFKLMFPAVTFCNQNRVNCERLRSRLETGQDLDQDEIQKLSWIEDNLCSSGNHSGEPDGPTLSPIQREFIFLQNYMGLNESARISIGHDFPSFIKNCTFKGKNCGNMRSVWCKIRSYSEGNYCCPQILRGPLQSPVWKLFLLQLQRDGEPGDRLVLHQARLPGGAERRPQHSAVGLHEEPSPARQRPEIRPEILIISHTGKTGKDDCKVVNKLLWMLSKYQGRKSPRSYCTVGYRVDNQCNVGLSYTGLIPALRQPVIFPIDVV